jgi:hypothetical protein
MKGSRRMVDRRDRIDIGPANFNVIPQWRRLVLVAPLCLGLAASCAAGAQGTDTPLPEIRSWTLAKHDLVPSPTRPFAYGLRLEMAMVRGTRWAPGLILDSVKRVAGILAQCGIRIEFVRLHEFDGPLRYRYLSTPDSREFARRSGLRKPAIFFVDDTRMEPPFEAEAVGRANARSRPEMTDTVWITWGTRDLPVALAHELVHVLANSGDHYSMPGNLMRKQTTPFNTKLAREQCSAIVSTAQANGLLDRLAPPGGRPHGRTPP